MKSVDLTKLTARADAFTLLEMLTSFPEPALLQAAVDGSLAADMDAICLEGEIEGAGAADALRVLQGQDGEGGFATARREYTQLFNHPERPQVQLYEGQFLYEAQRGEDELPAAGGKGGDAARPRLFVNPASLDMLRELRQAGLQQISDRAMPADAMPVQMGFAAQLCARQAQAIIGGDESAYAAAAEAFAELRLYHLDKWMAPFFEAVGRHASHPLYRAVACFGVAVYEALGCRDQELSSAA